MIAVEQTDSDAESSMIVSIRMFHACGTHLLCIRATIEAELFWSRWVMLTCPASVPLLTELSSKKSEGQTNSGRAAEALVHYCVLSILNYITHHTWCPYEVSVFCQYDLMLVPFFTAWMIVFFSMLIIIPTFHSNIVVAHFVIGIIETMITADYQLSNDTKNSCKMRTIST